MKTKISIENTTIYFRRRSFQTPNTKEGKAETTVGPLHASYIICIISDHHCFNAFLRRGGLRGTHRAQTSWERASMTLKIMLQKFIDEPLHCGTSSGKPKKNIGCLRLDSWFTPDSSATKKWSMSEGAHIMWVFMDIQKETSPETIINQAFRELHCLCDHRCNGINLDQAQSLKEPNGSEPQESRSTSTEKIIVYSVWPLFKAVQTGISIARIVQFNQSAIGEVVSFSLSYSNLPFERIRSFTSSLIAGKQLDMTPSVSIFEGWKIWKSVHESFQFFTSLASWNSSFMHQPPSMSTAWLTAPVLRCSLWGHADLQRNHWFRSMCAVHSACSESHAPRNSGFSSRPFQALPADLGRLPASRSW